MKKSFLGIVFFILLGGFAQENDLEIPERLHANDAFFHLNIDSKDFSEFEDNLIRTIDEFATKSSAGRTFKLAIIFHKDKIQNYYLSSNPTLEDTAYNSLLHSLNKIPVLNTHYDSYIFEYLIKINGGGSTNLFEPSHKKASLVLQEMYKDQPLIEQGQYIKNWSVNVGLPLLFSSLEKEVANDTLLITYINALKRIDFSENQNIAALTDYNPLYWQVQKNTENPTLLPALKSMLLITQGQYSYALTYQITFYESLVKDALPAFLISRLFMRIFHYFNKELALLEKGFALQKKGQNEGYTLFSKVHAANPKSATFFDLLEDYPDSITLKYGMTAAEMKTARHNSDPIYLDRSSANSKKEAYLNHLRASIEALVIDPSGFHQKPKFLCKSALHLEAYAFAADLACILLKEKSITKNDKIQLEMYYNYALEHLDMLENPDKETEKNNKRMTKELRKEIKRSPIYKNFEQ